MATAVSSAPATRKRRQKKPYRKFCKHTERSIPPLEPDPTKYLQHLAKKVEVVQAMLQEHLQGLEEELEVVPSPPIHFRHKFKYNQWHAFEDGSLGYQMLDPETGLPVAVRQNNMASKRINELSARLMEVLDGQRKKLLRNLIKVEFLSNSSGEGLVLLAYSGPYITPEFWEEDLAPLRQRLGAEGLVARSRGVRLFDGVDHLVHWTELQGRSWPQELHETMFSQGNLEVCKRMQRWALENCRPGRDYLELYCGNGNFTLPLAGQFRFAMATEWSKRGIAAARRSAQMAGVENLALLRMKDDEVAEALSPTGRPFRRLKDAGVDLAECDFGTCLVNPPRKGLSRTTQQLVQRMDNILYISCSPRTLKRDLERLPQHRVRKAAFFDQFPYTTHAEIGVCLERQA